jgi:hypothetical protein
MYALPRDLRSRRSFPEESLGTFSLGATTKPFLQPHRAPPKCRQNKQRSGCSAPRARRCNVPHQLVALQREAAWSAVPLTTRQGCRVIQTQCKTCGYSYRSRIGGKSRSSSILLLKCAVDPTSCSGSQLALEKRKKCPASKPKTTEPTNHIAKTIRMVTRNSIYEYTDRQDRLVPTVTEEMVALEAVKDLASRGWRTPSGVRCQELFQLRGP